MKFTKAILAASITTAFAISAPACDSKKEEAKKEKKDEKKDGEKKEEKKEEKK